MKVWIDFLELHGLLTRNKDQRKKIFSSVLKNFFKHVDLLDLEKEKVTMKRYPIYQKYYLTDVVIESKEFPTLSVNFPYSLYLLSNPDSYPLVVEHVNEVLFSNSTSVSQKLDFKTFLSILYEADRSRPISLTKTDVIVLLYVSNLHYYKFASVLHNASRLIKDLNLREKDRATIEKRMKRLKETCVWRPKFGNNLAPLGFQTFYIEWNESNWHFREKHPMHHLALLEVQVKESNFGIYQVPLYWALIDEIERIGGISLQNLTLSLNLTHLQPEMLAPYRRVKIYSASSELHLSTDEFHASTNSIDIRLDPDWENSSKITDKMITVIKYFSNPNNNIDNHKALTQQLGVSRELFSKYLETIVKQRILFYFPQFVHIGMDRRIIVISKEKDEIIRKMAMSGLTNAPRALIFNGKNISIAFLNVGDSQVKGISESISKLQQEMDILLLKKLEFPMNYKLQNLPFHKFNVVRRKDDKKLLYYHGAFPRDSFRP